MKEKDHQKSLIHRHLHDWVTERPSALACSKGNSIMCSWTAIIVGFFSPLQITLFFFIFEFIGFLFEKREKKSKPLAYNWYAFHKLYDEKNIHSKPKLLEIKILKLYFGVGITHFDLIMEGNDKLNSVLVE